MGKSAALNGNGSTSFAIPGMASGAHNLIVEFNDAATDQTCYIAGPNGIPFTA